MKKGTKHIPQSAAQRKSFAEGYNFYKLFWIFFIGCFAGVIVEMLWCLATRGYLESRRGLIYGWFNPVYGFGALLMTIALRRLADKRDLWMFLGSALIGGAFEFVCSLFQETCFGTVSWDYSRMSLSLADGRTSLLYMFFWGLLGLLWVKEIYPRLSRLIERIPNRWGVPVTWVLLVFMCLNMAVSAAALARQSARREGQPAQNAVESFLDRHYDDARLKKIYPNMVVVEKE